MADTLNGNAHPLTNMQQLAADYKLLECFQYAQSLLSRLQGAELGEAYLYLAQLRLLAGDVRFEDDLRQAEELLQGSSSITPFFAVHEPLDPNLFIVFQPGRGQIPAYLKALRRAQEPMLQAGGVISGCALKLMEAEILYFQGQFHDAIAMAKELLETLQEEGRYDYAMLAGHILLRCYLASGMSKDTENIIKKLIAWSGKAENCKHIYNTVRAWMNLTTGWGGEVPRYYTTPEGKVLPALENRVVAIEQGIGRLGPAEEAVAELARFHNPAVHTMRGYYMEIFDAMVDFKYGKRNLEPFKAIYETAQGNNLIMPLAEYGKQVLPLLDYAQHAPGGEAFDKDWLIDAKAMASLYEDNLNTYCTG